MKRSFRLRFCTLLIGLAVLAGGCSQANTSASSASTESSSAMISSATSSVASESMASSEGTASSESIASSVSSESAPVSVSSQSSESVVSSAPVASESSVPQEAPAWWETFLDSDLGEVLTEMRYYDSSRKISVGANYFEFSKQTDSGDLGLIRDTAEPVTLEELGAPLTGISSFEVLIAFDTKYTGKFYENGIALTKSEPKQEAGEPVYLSIGEEDYQELLSRCAENFASEGFGKHPSWLTIMRLYKLDSIVGTCDNGETVILDSESGERYNVWRFLRDSIRVEPDSVKTVTVDSKLSNCETILVNFINGIQYQIQINKTSILIASSDMSYALKYTLEGNPEYYLRELDADNWDYYENPVTG